MSANLIAKARRFYRWEMNDWHTYSLLARHSHDPDQRALLERIAAMEKRHAAFWAGILERYGQPLPDFRPRRLRALALRLLQRRINPLLLIAALELGETGAVEAYHRLWQSRLLPADDHETLRGIILDELEHEATFRRQTRESGLQNIRDFVLGMNDGLVEILGAVTGLSAAYARNLLLVGVSGLVVGIAGALSMGIGAFISVRSQRQVNTSARQRMEVLFNVAPERAVAEYRERLVAAGLPDAISDEVASRLSDNRAALSKLLLKEVSENEWRSGLFTGSAYLFGVLFPVLPYFLAEHALPALIGSIFLAGLALTVVGGFIALVSGIRLRTKVIEMLASGLGAAGLAWLFGTLMQALFGISV